MPPEDSELSFIDRLGIEVEADLETTWEALLSILTGSLESRGSKLAVRLLGSTVTGTSGPRPLAPGSTLPGFRVTASSKARELVLDGSHRFARNEMAFGLAAAATDRTELTVVTRADFPGPIGTLYRAFVIGTGGHVIATRRLLKAVGREAESREPTA